MSQKDLAERMRERGWKWSQATVWSIEKGERPLRLAEAEDVSAVLGGIGTHRLTAPEPEAVIWSWMHVVSRAHGQLEAAIQEYWDAQDQLTVAAEQSDIHPESGLGQGVIDWITREPEDVAGVLRNKLDEANRREFEDIGISLEQVLSTQGPYARARSQKWESLVEHQQEG